MASLIREFQLYEPGYGGAVVYVYIGATQTLASLFYDEAATLPAPNPITLENYTVDGCNYGRWAQPVYTTATSYRLDISGVHQTGVFRPSLSTLTDEDASGATVEVDGGEPIALADALARVLHVAHYGTLQANDPTSNTTILEAVIGNASGQGGGVVVLPAGSFAFNDFSLSTKVILRGAGEGVTTMRAPFAGGVITVTGDGAGLEDLTLDGETLVPDGIGIDTGGFDLALRRVRVKRFELGIKAHGSERITFASAHIENCVTGMEAWSRDDPEDEPFRFMTWAGGSVTTCTTTGLHFRDDVGLGCRFVEINGVRFADILGDAELFEGAHHVSHNNCDYENNIRHQRILDNLDEEPEVPSIGITYHGCEFNDGLSQVEDTAQDVVFERCRFRAHTWDIDAPTNSIVLIDCIEESDVAVDGSADRLQRRRTGFDGQTTLTTELATSRKLAWSAQLEPGQVMTGMVASSLSALNGVHYQSRVTFFHARRPGATLNFDAQTANFTLGQIITGQTSLATARVTAQTDSGASGNLTIRQIVGEFEDNEVITDPLGGSAQVNGPVTFNPVAAIDNSSPSIWVRSSDSWFHDVVATSTEVQVTVTEHATVQLEWHVAVSDVVLTT